MSEGNTTRIFAQEALRRIERGESLTDWARVRALSDAEIESAAARDPEWQDVDPDWVAEAKLVRPVRKRRLTLALDEDVIDWFLAGSPLPRTDERDPARLHGAPSRVSGDEDLVEVFWSDDDAGCIAVESMAKARHAARRRFERSA